MRSFTGSLILITLLGWSDAAEAGLLGLSGYEECVLDSMRGVDSDKAARSIRQACREKFPEKRSSLAPREDRLLSRSELGALTIGASKFLAQLTSLNAESSGPVAGIRFEVRNPHANLSITELTVSIISAASKEPLEYRATCNVPPNSAGEIVVSILQTEREGFSWGVVGGRGRD